MVEDWHQLKLAHLLGITSENVVALDLIARIFHQADSSDRSSTYLTTTEAKVLVQWLTQAYGDVTLK